MAAVPVVPAAFLMPVPKRRCPAAAVRLICICPFPPEPKAFLLKSWPDAPEAGGAELWGLLLEDFGPLGEGAAWVVEGMLWLAAGEAPVKGACGAALAVPKTAANWFGRGALG